MTEESQEKWRVESDGEWWWLSKDNRMIPLPASEVSESEARGFRDYLNALEAKAARLEASQSLLNELIGIRGMSSPSQMRETAQELAEQAAKLLRGETVLYVTQASHIEQIRDNEAYWQSRLEAAEALAEESGSAYRQCIAAHDEQRDARLAAESKLKAAERERDEIQHQEIARAEVEIESFRREALAVDSARLKAEALLRQAKEALESGRGDQREAVLAAITAHLEGTKAEVAE